MNKLTILASSNLKELQHFFKSTSFSRALLVGIAVTTPILLGIHFGHLEIGLAICFGAFWSSPSDIVGSFRHKKLGILISAVLVMGVSFIGSYLHYGAWISLFILGTLSFGIAYISVYGFRASLISFSGLLALALSFGYNLKELEIYQYALFVGAGGLWYLLLAKFWQLINPMAETEELLAKTYILTADFIETRGKLIGPHADRENLRSNLLKLQSDLTENHKTLRELLILSRTSSGWSNYQDKRLLVFVQLVEMMETAIANPVNYERMDKLFISHPHKIHLFQELIFKMAQQLRLISKAGNKRRKLPNSTSISNCFDEIRQEVAFLDESKDFEEFLMLENFLDYQEKQFKKLKRIQVLLGASPTQKFDFIDRSAAKHFLETQDYDPMLLIRNFSFKSNIFRHSLRLSVTVMTGYILGSLLPFQNPYWILLTIIIIMRPSYGLTKTRAKDRIIGTFIGGAIALGMIFIIQDPYIYGALSIAFLVIALSLVQRNSKASAIFITLSVVFIYAILSEDILSVIRFRIADTVVGAVLSYAAMLWVWPSWESVGIKESIENSVRANKNFFLEIIQYYKQKGSIPTSFNLARKQAFLETSNLNSAFQRMAQEPESKQNNMDKNYELVVLNHNFLASLASLSTYLQHHETTPASEKFMNITGEIVKNMDLSLQCLQNQKCENIVGSLENNKLLEDKFPILNSLEIRNLESKDKQAIRDLQEAHLVWEQLQWLFTISSKMLELTATSENDTIT